MPDEKSANAGGTDLHRETRPQTEAAKPPRAPCVEFLSRHKARTLPSAASHASIARLRRPARAELGAMGCPCPRNPSLIKKPEGLSPFRSSKARYAGHNEKKPTGAKASRLGGTACLKRVRRSGPLRAQAYPSFMTCL